MYDPNEKNHFGEIKYGVPSSKFSWHFLHYRGLLFKVCQPRLVDCLLRDYSRYYRHSGKFNCATWGCERFSSWFGWFAESSDEENNDRISHFSSMYGRAPKYISDLFSLRTCTVNLRSHLSLIIRRVYNTTKYGLHFLKYNWW